MQLIGNKLKNTHSQNINSFNMLIMHVQVGFCKQITKNIIILFDSQVNTN